MAVKTEPGLQARVAKSTAQLRAVLFLLKNNIANQSEQNGKLVFAALKKRCHCEERSDVAIPRIFLEVRKTGKRPNKPS